MEEGIQTRSWRWPPRHTFRVFRATWVKGDFGGRAIHDFLKEGSSAQLEGGILGPLSNGRRNGLITRFVDRAPHFTSVGAFTATGPRRLKTASERLVRPRRPPCRWGVRRHLPKH